MCEKTVQRSLAAILGEIGLLRATFYYSDFLDDYLKIMETEVHNIFEICEKCDKKGGESCLERTTD
jgi:hypothetical protein